MENSIEQWLLKEPSPDYISPAPGGGYHIEIDKLEILLDKLNWSTQNFHFHIFKNGYGDNVIAASIELVIEYLRGDNIVQRRTFVGACNFSITAIFPNVHYIATAKSMCIKNAATDIGKVLGRGLNADIMPSEEAKTESEGGVKLLTSIHQVKPDQHVKERKNITDTNTK